MLTFKDVNPEITLLANMIHFALDQTNKDGDHKNIREETLLKRLELSDGNSQFENAIDALHSAGVLQIKINSQNETRSFRRLSEEEKKKLAKEKKALAANKKAMEDLNKKYEKYENGRISFCPSSKGVFLTLGTKDSAIKIRIDIPLKNVDSTVEAFEEFSDLISALE